MRTLARRISWLGVLIVAFWGVASAQTQGSSSQNPTNKTTAKSTTSTNKPATAGGSSATKTSSTSKPATTNASSATKTPTTSKPPTTTSGTNSKSTTTAQGDSKDIKNGGAKDDFKQVGSDTAGAGKATGSAFKKIGTKVGSGTKNSFNRVVGKDDKNKDDKDDKNKDKDDKNKNKDEKGNDSGSHNK